VAYRLIEFLLTCDHSLGLLRDMLEYNGGCAHVETLVKSIEEYNVQQRTPLALEEPNWAKFVRECLVASDLPVYDFFFFFFFFF
jgi:hypothetical protein